MNFKPTIIKSNTTVVQEIIVDISSSWSIYIVITVEQLSFFTKKEKKTFNNGINL